MKTDEQLSDLLKTIATLRSDHGCPWDKRQTPQSMKKYLLEECRELAEAIDNNDPENVCEEIGDLYFILGMLSTMYAESGSFHPDLPLRKINEKMIRRHPHVFAGTSYESEEELREQWEAIKSSEK